MQMTTRLALCLIGVLVLVGAAGCTDTANQAPSMDPGPDGFGPEGEPDDPALVEGWKLYKAQCARCHGDLGEGLSAPAVAGWAAGEAALVQSIDLTMPKGAVELCKGECATEVARYILSLPEPRIEVDCDAPEYPPRRLRLLTRREYSNTIRDLLGTSVTTCGGVQDCAFASQSCQQGRCVEDPCGVHTFFFDAGDSQFRSVHVAGSFNGWPGSVGEGGWALDYVPEAGVWMLKQAVPVGERFEYKFVLDESEWITDPSHDNRADDGFGGQNSLLEVSCQNAPGPGGDTSGLTANFPPESRPSGYAFDNNAGAGRVTATHVEEYMRAAESLAEDAVSDLGALLPCDPNQADDACRRNFVTSFGLSAFRRPLSEAEIARYIGLIEAQDALDKGISAALQVMLSSPNFLYRSEIGEPEGSGHFRLTPWEIATALSYAYWGTMPDQALFDDASSGALASPQTIEAQARRLLADPRARDVLGVFALQWLGVEKILSVDKRPDLFQGFDRATREAMLDETRRFVTHVIFDSTHQFDELLTADYTLASPALADLYELPDAAPDGTRPYIHGRRSGILGHGSVLATTSHSDQTSPILRGVFVRHNLLCQEFGAPPPNAGGVPDVDPNATTRERFRQHSDNDACRSCHQYIDEVGFGFERFDAVGRWRETEHGIPIDPTGNIKDIEALRSGTDAPFDDLPGLARALADSRAAKACFATQVYRFTMGALETPQDSCELTKITARFEDSGDDIQALIIAITLSDNFTLRSAR